MTFYDIDCWDFAELSFDIFSILFFVWILSIFLIVGFSKLSTFQAAKPLYFYTGLSINVMIIFCFTFYYAIILSFLLSLILYWVYNKYDVPNISQLALKGATGLSVAKVNKQLEDYERLTNEEKNEIGNNAPNMEKIKVHFLSWLIITFVVPATISLIIKVVVGY